MKAYLPDVPAVVREAVTVVAGALLAAWLIGQVPAVKAWIKDQWQ